MSLRHKTGSQYQAVFTNSTSTAPRMPQPSPYRPPDHSSGQVATAASSYNLTTLGTRDWAHWGRGGSYSNFDHKSTGGSQISNVTVVGAGSNNGGWSDASRGVTWTAAHRRVPSPMTEAISGQRRGEHRLLFTVPADTTTRTLTVYAGGNKVSTSLTAHLSDGSAVDFVATASGSGVYTRVYTITYHAASRTRKLVITFLKTANIVGTDGSADLIAAMLA